MNKATSIISGIVLSVLSASVLAEAKPADVYSWTSKLAGDWKLAPADMQVGKATTKGPAGKMMNTDSTAISFQTTGRGSAIQEVLLPGTKKEMVTMYHCYDQQCSWVKATHYCAKKNQPEFKATVAKSSVNKMTYDCDMETDLCNSNDDHVHKIEHELVDNDTLRTTYTSWKDGEFLKKSVYTFVRK